MDPSPSAPRDPHGVLTRRAVVLGGLGAVGAGALWTSGHMPTLPTTMGANASVADDEPHAYCADAGSLERATTIGSAKLVYELDQRATPMDFDPSFHAQLVRWLADWNTSSRYGGVKQLWSYGAYVPKDDCHSWHAAGRAFDFSRLRAGDNLLVSCRTDLWPQASAARQAELTRRYWTLAASLHLHFAYVLTFHFDELHKNHIHVDNGISGSGMSRFDPGSRVQSQAVQAICATIWGRPGEVTGDWSDAKRQVAPVLDDLGVSDLRRQETWQAFLRASVKRG